MTEVQTTDLPVKKSSEGLSKRTLYLPHEIDEIWAIGNDNGWDVSEIARRAVTEALLKHQTTLRTKAHKKF